MMKLELYLIISIYPSVEGFPRLNHSIKLSNQIYCTTVIPYHIEAGRAAAWIAPPHNLDNIHVTLHGYTAPTFPLGQHTYSYLLFIPLNVCTFSPTISFLSFTTLGLILINSLLASLDLSPGLDICWFPNLVKLALSSTPTNPTCSSGCRTRCIARRVLTRLNSPLAIS